MIHRLSLFETPVYRLKASNHQEIKEWMLNEVVPVYEREGFNEQSRKIFSSYFPGAPKINQKKFVDFYIKDIQKFLTKAGYSTLYKWEHQFKFWYNLSCNGSYQEVHDHLGGPIPISYAAIHYVIFDKNEHFSTVFYNPLESILKTLQPTTKDQLRPHDFQVFQKTLDVEEGDLIIFPSYVSHSVMTQLSDKLRATIAFNISIYEKETYE